MKRIIGWLLCWALATPLSFGQYTVPYPSHKKASGGGGGTPALVGSGAACDSGGFNSTNVTCNYTIVNSGDTVVVFIGSYAAADWTPTITAGKVTSFTASANGHVTTPAGAGKFGAIYFGKSNASGADTVTCGKGGTTTICSVLVFTFSNTSAPTEDKTANANGTGTSLASGSTAATTAAVEILVGCGYDSDHFGSWTVGTSVAWAQAQVLGDSFGVGEMCEYFITSSTGTYNADASFAAGGNWSMQIATIKPN